MQDVHLWKTQEQQSPLNPPWPPAEWDLSSDWRCASTIDYMKIWDKAKKHTHTHTHTNVHWRTHVIYSECQRTITYLHWISVPVNRVLRTWMMFRITPVEVKLERRICCVESTSAHFDCIFLQFAFHCAWERRRSLCVFIVRVDTGGSLSVFIQMSLCPSYTQFVYLYVHCWWWTWWHA